MNVCKKRTGTKTGVDQYPRMLEVARAGGNVTGLVHALIDGEVIHCRFAIRPRDGRLVLAGTSRARIAAAALLAEVVEGKPRPRVVHALRMGVKQMLLLFSGIAGQDRRNITSRLALHFEPKLGRECAQETYTLIAYSLVENRCASNHMDFESLCKDAKSMEMQLMISRCAGVVPEPRAKRHAMVAKPDCAFRMYRDVPLDDWLWFCDEMLGFLDEVGG